MRLGDILAADGVRVLSAAGSKKRLFQELAEMAAASCGLDAAVTAEALLAREGLGPTGVGNGVALPHARVPGAGTVRGFFVRLEKPLDFDAVDRQPVDLVFCLIAPPGAGVDHLKALALVSRTLREPAVCAKLRANADPAKLHAILTEAQVGAPAGLAPDADG